MSPAVIVLTFLRSTLEIMAGAVNTPTFIKMITSRVVHRLPWLRISCNQENYFARDGIDLI